MSPGIQPRTGGRSQIRTNMAMKLFLSGRKKRPIRFTKGQPMPFLATVEAKCKSCCVQWAAS